MYTRHLDTGVIEFHNPAVHLSWPLTVLAQVLLPFFSRTLTYYVIMQVVGVPYTEHLTLIFINTSMTHIHDHLDTGIYKY